jgi:hypothetical protein
MTDVDRPDPGDKGMEGDRPDPHASILEAKWRRPAPLIDSPEMHYPFGATRDAQPPKPIADPLLVSAALLAGWKQRYQAFKANPLRVYASAAVGCGILFGVVFAAVSWRMGNTDGPYDFGSVTSSAVGLKGRLFAKWDKQLTYRLALEASDPGRKAGFALAVAHPPRPLSINVQLNDGKGFALCSWDILLKYDARDTAVLAASSPGTQAGKMDAAIVSKNQPAQAIDFARLNAEEQQREQGKDIFQNEIGPDGQIAAINAQGEAPCSKKAYESTSYWSLSSNFPSLAEQDELRKRQLEAQARAERSSYATRRKIAPKASVNLTPFSFEGDDEIVEFDASRGVIETEAGKTFFFDKAAAAGADSRWQDFPVSVHYKCNQNADCTLAHSGAGALHVRLRR